MKSQLIALAAAALLAAAGVSQAQDANPSSAPASGGSSGNGGAAVANIRSSCAADVQKMCPSVSDAASYRQCLTDNYASLSDGCKSAIAAYQASMQSSGGGH
jgi:hypothetical protein